MVEKFSCIVVVVAVAVAVEDDSVLVFYLFDGHQLQVNFCSEVEREDFRI